MKYLSFHWNLIILSLCILYRTLLPLDLLYNKLFVYYIINYFLLYNKLYFFIYISCFIELFCRSPLLTWSRFGFFSLWLYFFLYFLRRITVQHFKFCVPAPMNPSRFHCMYSCIYCLCRTPLSLRVSSLFSVEIPFLKFPLQSTITTHSVILSQINPSWSAIIIFPVLFILISCKPTPLQNTIMTKESSGNAWYCDDEQGNINPPCFTSRRRERYPRAEHVICCPRVLRISETTWWYNNYELWISVADYSERIICTFY